MAAIHADNNNTRYPCARCGEMTRCNDLLGSDAVDLNVCGNCLHQETTQELDTNNEYFTDFNIGSQGTPQDSDPLEGPDIEWHPAL